MKKLLPLVFVMMGCGGGGGGSYTPPSEATQSFSMRIEIAPFYWRSAPDSVERWLMAVGGRLLSRQKEENRAYFYSMRLPKASAKPFVDKIKSLGILLSEQTTMEDITKATMDIEARLRAKEEAVERLRNLLRQARTPSEILETEKALQTALAERDELHSQYEGQRISAEYVRLELTLRNRRYLEYSQGGSYWLQLWRSVEAGWNGFVYLTFALAYLWWLWLIVGGVILLLRRRRPRSAAN